VRRRLNKQPAPGPPGLRGRCPAGRARAGGSLPGSGLLGLLVTGQVGDLRRSTSRAADLALLRLVALASDGGDRRSCGLSADCGPCPGLVLFARYVAHVGADVMLVFQRRRIVPRRRTWLPSRGGMSAVRCKKTEDGAVATAAGRAPPTLREGPRRRWSRARRRACGRGLGCVLLLSFPQPGSSMDKRSGGHLLFA
jgi:hypothetical protein